MTAHMEIEFSWDVRKARDNLTKHGVSFTPSTAIFRDPLALSVFDSTHSENEDRWVTIGKAENGQYLVVAHTYDEVGVNLARIRIISARNADRDEVRNYENTSIPWRIEEANEMNDHYDFSKGTRGQFYKDGAAFRLPVYLDEEIEKQLSARAEKDGVDLSELVNELLKREIASNQK